MLYKLGLFLTGNALIRRGASCLFNVGELSSECGASRLGASFFFCQVVLGRGVFGVSCPVSFGTKLN